MRQERGWVLECRTRAMNSIQRQWGATEVMNRHALGDRARRPGRVDTDSERMGGGRGRA